METIRGIEEAVEAQDEFATSIVARDESLALYSSLPGLGPPDLCWLQKASKGAYFSSAASEPRGFFHYCLGRDVSSSAAIAAYFAELNSKVDPISVLQGLWYTSETMIQRGFYCCYDPFSRLDIRCELCIPGGVVCGALDADGTVHEVTPEMWRNCAVAAFLRYQLFDPDLTSHAPVLHRWQPVSSPEQERQLLNAVYDMYASGALPRALEYVTADVTRGCVAEHMDLVLYTLYQYFGARHRWNVALEFFKRVQKVYNNAAVLVAAVQRELDSFDDSFATLTAALEASPQEPCLLLALGNECLYADQLDMAAKLARKAVRIQRELRPAWLLLARCYIRQGLYSLALITINVVPPPPMPTPEQELLFGILPPDPKYVTKPTSVRYDPDVAGAKQMHNEEVTSDGSRALLYLPAAVMVPHEPLDLGAWPDLGPARVTRAVLSSAYGLLQELVAAIGWDNFLEMRARVFVMQSEAAGKFSSGSAPQQAAANNGPPGAAAGTPLYDLALEELAAIGLDEHPEEVQAARAANAAAAAAAAAENGDDSVPAAAPTPPPAGAASAPLSEHGGDANASVARVAPDASPAVSRQDKLPQDGDSLAPIASLPTAMSAMTSIWGMMFGAPKTQPARGEVSESQIAKLQSHGSSGTNQAPKTNTATATTHPGPIAEATTTTHLHKTHKTHTAHTNIAGPNTDTTNPWQGTQGPNPVAHHALSWQNDDVTHASSRGGVQQGREGLGWLSGLSGLLRSVSGSQGQGQVGPAPVVRRLEFDGAGAGPVGEAQVGRAYESDYDTDDDPHSSDGAYSDNSTGVSARRKRSAPQNGSQSVAANYSGGPLSNVAADREFVLLGSAAIEEEHQAKAKRLCVRWLDELIIALWHDLQAYMEWKAQDSDLQKSVGNTLAGLVLGLPNAKSTEHTGEIESSEDAKQRASSVPTLPPGDWMRRGLLAERLYHDSEALLAYRCCLAGSAFNVMAGLAVMRLAAEAGDAKLALQACFQVLSWHVTQLPQAQRSAFPPTAVVCCVGHVAALTDAGTMQQTLDQVVEAAKDQPNAEAAGTWLKQLVTASRLVLT